VDERINLTEQALSLDSAFSLIRSPDYGAVVLFAGTVRSLEDGKPIHGIIYEAYTEMAVKEIKKIIAAAEARWQVKLSVQHRLGYVPTGEISFLVSAAGKHRPEAFEACRFTVDEAKEKVPIWKAQYLQEKQGVE
jgi:molybdopterin synthase catalytic subunit